MSRALDTRMALPADASRRAVDPAVAFFVVLAAVLLLAGRHRLFADPGVFWHTVVGRTIAVEARLPTADPFGFRHATTRWIPQQWLAELLMALIERRAGWFGLLLAATALLAGSYAAAAGRLLRAGVEWPVAATWLVLAIGASSYHFLVRPHLLTIALLGGVYVLLLEIDAGRARRGAVVALPVIIALWSNLHGGALGGVATVAFVAFGWLLERARAALGAANGRTPPVPIGLALALPIACAAATLVNPFGAELPRAWLQLMRMPALPRIIVEHAPPSLTDPATGFGLLLAIGYFAALRRRGWRNARLAWLAPAAWLLLAATRVRHGPLFAMTTLVALGEILRGPAGVDPGAPARRGSVGLVAVAALLIGLLLPAIGILPRDADGCGPRDRAWPTSAGTALCAALEQSPAAPRVINDMRLGGWLTWHVPRARLFIDDRCELYSEAELVEYEQAAQHDPARIERWADDGDARLAFVIAGGSFDHHLSAAPRWRMLARDSAAACYERCPASLRAQRPRS
ncbi:MAG: hypothetical protein U1A27_08685 [Phycisphaerae bacterium]